MIFKGAKWLFANFILAVVELDEYRCPIGNQFAWLWSKERLKKTVFQLKKKKLNASLILKCGYQWKIDNLFYI